MLTYKLKIKSISDSAYVQRKQINYSYAFRKLYKNFDKLTDPTFKNWMWEEFELDSWDWSSLREEVKVVKSQENTRKAKILKKILGLEEALELIKSKKQTKSSEIKICKLAKSLKRNKRMLSKDIVFGGRKLLVKVSKKDKDYLEAKEEYSKCRLRPIYSAGECNPKGNRKFKLDIENWMINYNQNRKTNISVEVFPAKNWQENLLKVQELACNKKIPVHFKLDLDYIWITFDESALKGYYIGKKDMYGKNKDHKQEVYRNMDFEKAHDKLSNRFCGVDLNPENIGLSICDKGTNGELIQIYKECIDLAELNKNLGLPSEDGRQIHQNNKRKHEICESWKYVFELCKHYKVSNFVVEDLNFSEDKKFGKTANRKIRNFWHRNLTTNLITKHCNILGIKMLSINPAYSSFIGNIQHSDFDPVSASLEICRRGFNKYIKGSILYPEITKKDVITMSNLVFDQVRDDECQSIDDLTEVIRPTTWSEWYYLFYKLRIKFRRQLSDISHLTSTRFFRSSRSKIEISGFRETRAFV